MNQIYQYIDKMNRHFQMSDSFTAMGGRWVARAKWHNDQGQWYKAALESVDVKLENDHRGLFRLGGFK